METIALVEELIESGELDRAQSVLYKINNKSARWHYLQGKVFQLRKWYSEARKQFSLAVKAEPSNTDYKAALDDLENFSKNNKKEFKKGTTKRRMERFASDCVSSCGSFC